MEPIDYKALARERKAKRSRPIVRHVICLDPELYAEHDEAKQELQEHIVAEQREDGPKPDRRGGGLSPRAVAEERVAEIEKRIARVSVVGVFKAPPSDQQAAAIDALVKEQEDNQDRAEAIMAAHSRETILRTFEHFEGPGRKRIDLDKQDLEEMLPDWSQGEVYGLANRINRASTEAHEAPKSVRLSLNNLDSDAT